MDFEPRQEGVTFEVAAPLETRGDPGAQELSAYCRALEAGVREKLAGQRAGTSAAVAVVLRGIRVHPTDSHPRAFHMAGCLAAGKALLVAYGPPPRSQRRRAPAGDTRRCYLGCLGPGARGRASCVLRLAGLCP
ncbi:hypothetical protein LHJ74_00360 [Streptomyces sp. N2-109]|uniref:Uncharacterized protein n=1 Tax=Streptomyces gossypii TaxID=2883101 RepID=A0ABT2JKM5_9ACTN|nr:hypothetical protein [Streptomyces gossypii]MCT2588411.1 hypothetical protein [Streptomyces gossypii]